MKVVKFDFTYNSNEKLSLVNQAFAYAGFTLQQAEERVIDEKQVEYHKDEKYIRFIRMEPLSTTSPYFFQYQIVSLS